MVATAGHVYGAGSAPLTVESRIPLGEVHGRIDHLAVDLKRQRLYVAELGNDSVGILDLAAAKTVQTLRGLQEPQGIGYDAATDTLYVANARDGSVRFFRGADLAPSGSIALGEDADNVRIEEDAHHVWVGYGNGALAVIDSSSRLKIGEIPLNGHPESFRLSATSSAIYVNVPDSGEIVVVDRASNRRVASWKTDNLHANFPLALDGAGQVLVSESGLLDPGLDLGDPAGVLKRPNKVSMSLSSSQTTDPGVAELDLGPKRIALAVLISPWAAPALIVAAATLLAPS